MKEQSLIRSALVYAIEQLRANHPVTSLDAIAQANGGTLDDYALSVLEKQIKKDQKKLDKEIETANRKGVKQVQMELPGVDGFEGGERKLPFGVRVWDNLTKSTQWLPTANATKGQTKQHIRAELRAIKVELGVAEANEETIAHLDALGLDDDELIGDIVQKYPKAIEG